MPSELTLISHTLCPYVQRAAIVLLEKGVAYTRRDIDLQSPPQWFSAISPLGKVPVLLVDQQPIFESAVICEYLDETLTPRLHPQSPLLRAQHRAWMEFGSVLLSDVWHMMTAATAEQAHAAAEAFKAKTPQLEAVLSVGPYFAGAQFSIVDAVFAPVWRYMAALPELALAQPELPKLSAWQAQLAARPSVQQAVSPHYAQQLRQFVRGLDSWLATQMVA